MSELAKCRLCGSEALDYSVIKLDIPFTNCTNEDCPMSNHCVDKAAWNLLNAPDSRVAELVKENEALRVLMGEAAEVLCKTASWSCSDAEDAIIKLQEACDNGIEGGSDV